MIKVLIFNDFFYPGYKGGGVLRSLYNLVNSLDGIHFYVVAKNKDLGDSTAYREIPCNQWLQKEGYSIKYLSSWYENPIAISKLIQEIKPDYIHINCIYQLSYGIIPTLYAKFFLKASKIILSANGMLSKNALQIKRHKKSIYLWLIKKLGVFNEVVWHATNEVEATDIQVYFGKAVKIKIAPYIVNLEKSQTQLKNKKEGEVKLVHLSRISPVKNLLFLLNCLKSMDLEIHLKIIGPVTNLTYFQDCKKIISELPNNIHIELVGEIPFYQVQAYLQKEHFLILPSLTENYGHVIVEALNAGLPVIISNNTPWDELQSKNAGWVLPLTQTAYWCEVIRASYYMNNSTYAKMSKSAQLVAQEIIEDNNIIHANKALYSG